MELDYIALKVKDLNSSKTFYEALGLVFTPEKHGNGPNHFSAIIGGCVFELYPWQKEENTDFKTIRFGLAVSDLSEVIQKLTKLNMFTPIKKDVYPDSKSLELRDLDGRVIEIRQL